jgi:hypothetical protein
MLSLLPVKRLIFHGTEYFSWGRADYEGDIEVHAYASEDRLAA